MKLYFVRITLLFCLSFPLSSQALETDQFMVWGKELKDSASILDKLLNAQFSDALYKINLKKRAPKYSCEKVAKKILSHNGSRYSFLVKVEKMIFFQ